MRISIDHKKQDGFAIFAVPVIIVLFGLFATKLLNNNNFRETDLEIKTQRNLSEIREVLAIHAQQNFRIPCPAHPDASKETLGTQSALDDNGQCQILSGILPYRALSLPPQMAKDAWGNMLTYKVSDTSSKDITKNNLDFIGDETEPLPVSKNSVKHSIHQMCRTPKWISDNTNKYTMTNGRKKTIPRQKLNKNIHKAHFCCPSYLADKQYVEFRAEDYKKFLSSGRKRNVDFNGDIQLTAETIDKIPFWNGNENNEMRGSSQVLKRTNPYFDYVVYKKSDTNIEDGIGPIDGAFFNTAATFTLNPNTMNIKTLSIQLANIRRENWGEPVPISIETIDKEGKFIAEIGYTLKIPETTTGVATLNASILTILKGPIMEGLYYSGHWDGYDKKAVDWFIENKEEFITNLLRSKIKLRDVRISRVKLNATHTPLSISKIGYALPATPNLIVLNEKNKSHLPSRNNPNVFAHANIPYKDAVRSDNEVVAYVLMSHGADGEGAFAGNGTIKIIDNIDNALENPREIVNYANSVGRKISDVKKTISNNPKAKFDDIIQWDTQISLFGALNGGSCSDPL